MNVELFYYICPLNAVHELFQNNKSDMKYPINAFKLTFIYIKILGHQPFQKTCSMSLTFTWAMPQRSNLKINSLFFYSKNFKIEYRILKMNCQIFC